MKTSDAGIKLIKSFEGCRLTAYADSVGVLTIGYGHTSGVKAGMKITQAQADEFLRKDVEKFEKAVNALDRAFNQCQFDALVSFAFNCGAKNLKTLCANRTAEQIADAFLLYNKAGGKVLAGLTRRRKAEKALFEQQAIKYAVPKDGLKKGAKGDSVRWLQQALNDHGYSLDVDGDFGPKTEKALKDFQAKVFASGILDAATKSALLR